MTGLGAGSERVIENGLDGARASSAFGAAAEAIVNLLGVTREAFRDIDGVPDIVVAEEVAGTNNHESETLLRVRSNRYSGPVRDAKQKTAFSSDSKLQRVWFGMGLNNWTQRRIDFHGATALAGRPHPSQAAPEPTLPRPSTAIVHRKNRELELQSGQMWRRRSLIIQGDCGTFNQEFSTRKVKP
jgi:hypothetical protein